MLTSLFLSSLNALESSLLSSFIQFIPLKTEKKLLFKFLCYSIHPMQLYFWSEQMSEFKYLDL